MSPRPHLLTACLLLASCAGGGPRPPEPERLPRKATATQKETLDRIDILFRAGDLQELDKVLTAAREDPVLTKAIVICLFAAMKHAETSQENAQRGQLQVRSLEDNPRWVDLRHCFTVLGSAAVPVVRERLIEGRQGGEVRRRGIEILTAMGPEVIPEIRDAFDKTEGRHKRHYVAAVADMPPGPPVERQLLEWARDEAFDVRSAALRGLAKYGDRHLAMLRGVVARDSDEFVRRQVVEVLGPFKDRPTVAAVVGYYADRAGRRDDRGVRAAERTLIEMSGLPASRGRKPIAYGLDFWQKWVMTLPVVEERR